MSKGYVYVLTNPSMPGMVKIGKTTRTAQQRCDELWQTGVPTPFTIYAAILAPDCHALETYIHGAFAKERVVREREFFTVDPEKARLWIIGAAKNQVEDLVQEFLPDHIVVQEDLSVDQAALFKLADEAGESPEIVCDAFSFMTVEEIQSPIERRREFDERIAERRRQGHNVVQIHG